MRGFAVFSLLLLGNPPPPLFAGQPAAKALPPEEDLDREFEEVQALYRNSEAGQLKAALEAQEIAKRYPRLHPDTLAARWPKVRPAPSRPILSDPAFARYLKEAEDDPAATPEDLRKWYPISYRPGPAYPEPVDFAVPVEKKLAEWGGPEFAAGDFLGRVRRDGMAVSAAADFPNYFLALRDIFHADLPLIFTTDALLHTVYLSYDNLLAELETTLFADTLHAILTASLKRAEENWSDGDHVEDARLVLRTALHLLRPGRSLRDMWRGPADGPAPIPKPKDSAVAKVIAAIDAERSGTFTLFGRNATVDFTQFKPRGHYTKTWALVDYFRAVMWLSRADLAFDISPSPKPGKDPARARMKKASLVLYDCVAGSGSLPAWKELDGWIEFLVGPGDGLGMDGMEALAAALGGGDLRRKVARFDEKAFDAAVARGGFGEQAIASHVRFGAPGGKEVLPRISSFLPQRFVLDAFAFSETVNPKVPYRTLPSSLEAAFLLGDNGAPKDLGESTPRLMGGLAGLRRLYDGLAPEAWRGNLYTGWLGFLRQLNAAESNAEAAPAFRTEAWRMKMRNTQLASWAQLRHNTILYAKQSYTMGVICDFPRSYVEPYPAFYAAVGAYAREGYRRFRPRHQAIGEYFARLADVCDRLRGAAERTARGQELTDAQVDWIRNALRVRTAGGGCGGPSSWYEGWFMDLHYAYDIKPYAKKKAYTVADIHSKPQDDMGPAQVLHAATGPVQMMVAALPWRGCISYFVGPVASFYDVTLNGPDFRRLNDEEWTRALDEGSPLARRPPWTRAFLVP